jgi:hypothetical protein
MCIGFATLHKESTEYNFSEVISARQSPKRQTCAFLTQQLSHFCTILCIKNKEMYFQLLVGGTTIPAVTFRLYHPTQ